MSVENTNTVDYASIDKNGDVILTISDHLKWDDNSNHLLVLQDKINAYIRAIETGDIYRSYPDAHNRMFVINVIAKYNPNRRAKLFLDKTKKVLNYAGHGFKFAVLEE